MKTKYILKWQVSLLIVLSVLASCSEDWLAPKPLSIYTPDNAFVDVESMKAALTGCERRMRLEFYGDQMPMLTEYLFSDVAVNGVTDKAPPAQDLNLQITPSSQLNSGDYNKIGWYWLEEYKGIKYASAVIDRIDNIEFQAGERDAILSAGYFFRAYSYYRLTHQFGDVPYVGGEVQTPKVDYYSTRRDVILQKMKTDMEFAALNADVNPDRGRVTRGACGHLLTKINLSLGEFDDAIASATAVIDGGQHRLMGGDGYAGERFGIDAANPDRDVIYDLHRSENKDILANREALMIVISRESIDNDNNGRSEIMRNTLPAWSHPSIKTPGGSEAASTTVLGGNLSQYNYYHMYGRGQGQIRGVPYSTKMIWKLDNTDRRHQRSWYDDEGKFHQGNWMEMEDLRYNNPFILVDVEGNPQPAEVAQWHLQPYRLYSDEGVQLTIDTTRNWYPWPHYKTFMPDPTVTTHDYRGGRYPWYIYRLAETYLMRAEAYFWNNDRERAAADINAVRRRAGAREITADEVNMRMILDERARELYLEEPRKTELTRIAYIYAQTGKPADDGTVYSLDNFSDKNFFYDHIMATTHFYNKGVRTAFGNYYTMSPYHVLWPIPQKSINDNSVGVINQNKGYSGYERNVPPLTTIE